MPRQYVQYVESIPLQPMSLIRERTHLTDIPKPHDLTLHNGTLYVLLWKIYDHQHGWNLGWYPVAAPDNVINYLFEM